MRRTHKSYTPRPRIPQLIRRGRHIPAIRSGAAGPILRRHCHRSADLVDFANRLIQADPFIPFSRPVQPRGGTCATSAAAHAARWHQPHQHDRVPGDPFPAAVLSEGRSRLDRLIDWFDVVPPNTYSSGPPFDKLTIDPVSMQHANGVYSNPEWNKGDHLPQDWIDFVAGGIDRSRKVREHIEAAPHQLESA